MMQKYLTLEQFELYEKVLVPDKKLIEDVASALYDFRRSMKDELKEFKDDVKLTNFLNKFIQTLRLGTSLKFSYDPHREEPHQARYKKARICSAQRSIRQTTIFVWEGFWEVFFKQDEKEFQIFLTLFKEVFAHELVHDLQNKEITKKHGKHAGIVNLIDETKPEDEQLKQYLAGKWEIMAWARDAAEQLLLAFGYNKSLDVINDPDKYWNELQDDSAYAVYVSIFEKDDKVRMRFVRYVLEYLKIYK